MACPATVADLTVLILSREYDVVSRQDN